MPGKGALFGFAVSVGFIGFGLPSRVQKKGAAWLVNTSSSIHMSTT